MHARITAATVLALAVGAAGAGGAAAHRATSKVVRNCGTITVAGGGWRVGAAGVSCSQAKSIVRTAAPHATGGLFHQTISGLACIAGKGGGRRGIICISKDGKKSVYGARLG